MNEAAHPQEAIGALVLGALGLEEAAVVRRHLADCAACRREHDQLAKLPALLATMPEEAWTHPPKPSELGLQRLLARVRSERRAARKRAIGRVVAAGVAAAVVAAVAVLVGALVVTDRGTPEAAPSPPGTAASWVLQGRNPDLRVSGQITVVPVEWGSRLDVSVAGVKPGQQCRLVVIDDGGRRWNAGSWTVSTDPRAYESGPFSWSGSVAIPDDRIARVEMVTTDGERLLTFT